MRVTAAAKMHTSIRPARAAKGPAITAPASSFCFCCKRRSRASFAAWQGAVPPDASTSSVDAPRRPSVRREAAGREAWRPFACATAHARCSEGSCDAAPRCTAPGYAWRSLLGFSALLHGAGHGITHAEVDARALQPTAAWPRGVRRSLAERCPVCRKGGREPT